MKLEFLPQLPNCFKRMRSSLTEDVYDKGERAYPALEEFVLKILDYPDDIFEVWDGDEMVAVITEQTRGYIGQKVILGKIQYCVLDRDDPTWSYGCYNTDSEAQTKLAEAFVKYPYLEEDWLGYGFKANYTEGMNFKVIGRNTGKTARGNLDIYYFMIIQYVWSLLLRKQIIRLGQTQQDFFIHPRVSIFDFENEIFRTKWQALKDKFIYPFPFDTPLVLPESATYAPGPDETTFVIKQEKMIEIGYEAENIRTNIQAKKGDTIIRDKETLVLIKDGIWTDVNPDPVINDWELSITIKDDYGEVTPITGIRLEEAGRRERTVEASLRLSTYGCTVKALSTVAEMFRSIGVKNIFHARWDSFVLQDTAWGPYEDLVGGWVPYKDLVNDPTGKTLKVPEQMHLGSMGRYWIAFDVEKTITFTAGPYADNGYYWIYGCPWDYQNDGTVNVLKTNEQPFPGWRSGIGDESCRIRKDDDKGSVTGISGQNYIVLSYPIYTTDIKVYYKSVKLDVIIVSPTVIALKGVNYPVSEIKEDEDITAPVTYTATTVQVTGASWTVNEHTGRFVRVRKKIDPSDFQIKEIASNTINILTIVGSFSPIPNQSTHYYQIETKKEADCDVEFKTWTIPHILCSCKIDNGVIKDIKAYGLMAGNGLKPEERYQLADIEIYVRFEDDKSAKTIEDEKVGTGNGETLIFNKALSMKPIENTITIKVDVNLDVESSSPPDWKTKTKAGTITTGGTYYTLVLDTTLTHDAPAVDKHRYDILQLKDDGTLSIKKGTEVALTSIPVVPTPDANNISIAEIHVSDDIGSISDTEIITIYYSVSTTDFISEGFEVTSNPHLGVEPSSPADWKTLTKAGTIADGGITYTLASDTSITHALPYLEVEPAPDWKTKTKAGTLTIGGTTYTLALDTQKTHALSHLAVEPSSPTADWKTKTKAGTLTIGGTTYTLALDTQHTHTTPASGKHRYDLIQLKNDGTHSIKLGGEVPEANLPTPPTPDSNNISIAIIYVSNSIGNISATEINTTYRHRYDILQLKNDGTFSIKRGEEINILTDPIVPGMDANNISIAEVYISDNIGSISITEISITYRHRYDLLQLKNDGTFSVKRGDEIDILTNPIVPTPDLNNISIAEVHVSGSIGSISNNEITITPVPWDTNTQKGRVDAHTNRYILLVDTVISHDAPASGKHRYDMIQLKNDGTLSVKKGNEKDITDFSICPPIPDDTDNIVIAIIYISNNLGRISSNEITNKIIGRSFIDTPEIDGVVSTVDYINKRLHLEFKSGKAPDKDKDITIDYKERTTVELVKDILTELMIISRPRLIFIGEDSWAIEEPWGHNITPNTTTYPLPLGQTTLIFLKTDLEYSFYSPDGYIAIKNGDNIDIDGFFVPLVADGTWTATTLTIKVAGDYSTAQNIKFKRALVPGEDEKWNGAYRGFEFSGRI